LSRLFRPKRTPNVQFTVNVNCTLRMQARGVLFFGGLAFGSVPNEL
jgi:hypothetical protein